MEKKFNSRLALVFLALTLFFGIPKIIFAEFALSAIPYDGGYDLRYGKIDPALGRVNKEVTVTITSDIAKQYRIQQALLEPLTNAGGTRISPNNLFVYAIRGTNKTGTLNVEQEVPVALGQQLIYTSNQNGTADSFILVYGLIVSDNFEPGSYRGRISFTLEPIDSSQSPVIVILNILAELEIKSAIEIRTATGSKNIVLKCDREDMRSEDVVINIVGGFGKQFIISQLFTEQPVSSDGKLLDWEALNFSGRDARKGIVVNELTPLAGRQQIIYTSSPRGDADAFTIQYSLGDFSKQKAGRYRSRIKYLLEGIGFAQMQAIDTLNLEIENPRVFDLVVTPQMGGLIQFRDVKPLQPPKASEVIIQIKSNIGKKYQFTQKVLSDLTNKEGYVIKEENFTVRTESFDTKGALKFLDKAPIKKGDTVLFVSDSDGSADKFKIIYELNVPADYHAGDYSTRIVYSLSEI